MAIYADGARVDLVAQLDWRYAVNAAKSIAGGGAATAVPLFTVTGLVEAQVMLVGTATTVTAVAGCNCSVGIAGATEIFVANTDMNAVTVVTGEIWHDATPDALVEASSDAWRTLYTLSNGQDIIFSHASAVTGSLDCYARWRPVGPTGNLIAA